MGQMTALVWALLLIMVGLFLLVIIVIIIRVLAANDQGTLRQAPGPHYSHESKWFEYYRTPSRRTESETDPGESIPDGKSRIEMLPHCSNCGAATAFEQERCHKCGQSLKLDRT